MESIEKTKSHGCALKSIAGCGGLVIAIPLLLFVVFIGLWSLGGILIVADKIEHADALVVLSGGDNERVRYAAQLYRDGFGEYLILTETGISYPGNPKDSLEMARDLAVHKGVPKGRILTPNTVVNSTADEARVTLETAKNKGFSSLIIVTDPYHSFRTRLIFRTIFRGSGIKILVRPVTGHWYDSATWFLSVDGWKTTLLEYIKTFGFFLGFD